MAKLMITNTLKLTVKDAINIGFKIALAKTVYDTTRAVIHIALGRLQAKIDATEEKDEQ